MFITILADSKKKKNILVILYIFYWWIDLTDKTNINKISLLKYHIIFWYTKINVFSRLISFHVLYLWSHNLKV